MIAPLGKRLIGVSALTENPKNLGEVTGVSISALARRLLLFDQYVLVSVRLQEFPHLAQALGFDGLRLLLQANALVVRCEIVQMTEVGQSGLFGDRKLPNFSYKLNWIDMHDRHKYISDCLRSLHSVPSLTLKQVIRLKQLVVNNIQALPPNVRKDMWPNARLDILNSPLVKDAVALVLEKEHGIAAPNFFLRVLEDDETTFRVEHDLMAKTTLSAEILHRIISSALLGLTSVSQATCEMDFYSALSGFRASDLPFFKLKLRHLMRHLSTEPHEEAFGRVMAISGFSQENLETFNVERLLEIRQSPDAQQFRDWLQTCGEASEAEIAEMVNSFKSKLGRYASSGKGKAMRFVVTNAVSLIPQLSPVVGLALSAVDSFLLEKLLPRSGIAAFISESYPSIFKGAS